MRELSIFIDESGDFGPVQKHSPFYVLSLVFHDQSDDITGHLDKIHAALVVRGLSADHAIHTGPLIRREQDYRWLDIAARRSIFFSEWDRIVIYYDNGQKELTNLVNSVFNAHLTTVEIRRVVPSDYSLFQAADLCCTLALLRRKIETVGLSSSERDFFSTAKDGAERALKKGYFKTLDRQRLGD